MEQTDVDRWRASNFKEAHGWSHHQYSYFTIYTCTSWYSIEMTHHVNLHHDNSSWLKLLTRHVSVTCTNDSSWKLSSITFFTHHSSLTYQWLIVGDFINHLLHSSCQLDLYHWLIMQAVINHLLHSSRQLHLYHWLIMEAVINHLHSSRQLRFLNDVVDGYHEYMFWTPISSKPWLIYDIHTFQEWCNLTCLKLTTGYIYMEWILS